MDIENRKTEGRGEFYAAGTKRVDGCGGALLPDGHVVLEGVSQEG